MERLNSERERIYNALIEKIGDTPLYKIQNIKIPNNNNIYAKEEYKNPTGSVFDRLYVFLFKDAEERGLIVPGITPVVEASTGNAGAAFAWCARELGYIDCTVITHADTPKSRVKQIKSYGAKVLFSPAGEWAAGYVRELEKILDKDKKSKGKLGEDPKRMYCVTKIKRGSYSPGYKKLVDEIFKKVELVDYFICGVGSGTTISGIGISLKIKNPDTKVIAIEPEYSQVITEFKKGRIAKLPDKMDLIGIGAAGLPKEKLDIDLKIIDEITLVSDDDWKKGFNLLKEKEGKDIGRSSCAAFTVALKLSEKINNKNILILFADPSWKYDDDYPYMK